MIGTIPDRWKQLSGDGKWNHLLTPLDNDLKNYIIHYGAMAQATYDTFNWDVRSKNYGHSIYGKKNFFSRVGLVINNPFKYKVVRFIYATAKIAVPGFMVTNVSCNTLPNMNWMGYVAVATDEGKKALGRRDIVVAWRGTIEPIEWMKDFDYALVPAIEIAGPGTHTFVHHGIQSIYTSHDERSRYTKLSARDQVLSELKKQLDIYKNEEVSITVTGHSLGAGLALMSAGDIASNCINIPKSKPNKPCPVTAFVFACVRVGDIHYKMALSSLKYLHVLNIHNLPDVVPTIPPLPYVDVGVKMILDSQLSPYLNPLVGNTASWHNLEGAYLHPVSIANGSKEPRCLALINKYSSALKLEYPVPNYWWCLKNRGMVQKEDGCWVLEDKERDVSDEDESDDEPSSSTP